MYEVDDTANSLVHYKNRCNEYFPIVLENETNRNLDAFHSYNYIIKRNHSIGDVPTAIKYIIGDVFIYETHQDTLVWIPKLID